MEEIVECPRCLGYRCCVLYSINPPKLCSAYDVNKRDCIHIGIDWCTCELCNGFGFISWIDLLFNSDNTSFESTFKYLRDNTEEVERLIKERKKWRNR